MVTSHRFTTESLELMPDDGNRYEIIDGELYVSTQPSIEHQLAGGHAFAALYSWSQRTGRGIPILTPGVVFQEDTAVAPDIVWVSRERFPAIVGDDGKLHGAPELVVELLSPGTTNVRRDRETKRTLYSRRGVQEYWIVDWILRRVEVYRREDAMLQIVATLMPGDFLRSPLLPDFSVDVGDFFINLPDPQ